MTHLIVYLIHLITALLVLYTFQALTGNQSAHYVLAKHYTGSCL